MTFLKSSQLHVGKLKAKKKSIEKITNDLNKKNKSVDSKKGHEECHIDGHILSTCHDERKLIRYF